MSEFEDALEIFGQAVTQVVNGQTAPLEAIALPIYTFGSKPVAEATSTP
jgi:hypothetical protein